MQIRLFKPIVREEAIAAACDAMRSGWLGMGPKVAEFERAFATHVGATHAVGLNTGTSAVHLAFKLLNLPAESEVITSPITFVGANQTILYENLKPVFADVDLKTGNITPETVAACITRRTRAIMLTHLAGYACDLDDFRALAQKHDLKIVEDAAHAAGARYRGNRIGSSGNLCAFSFDPIKNLTTGEGGMLVVPDEALLRRARNLRYMGMTKDAFQRVNGVATQQPPWVYDVPELGHRYHMNDLAASIGLAHLKYLDADNAKRRELVQHYRRELQGIGGVRLPDYADDRECSHHLFWILAENRDALAEKLMKLGVIVGVHYTRNDNYAIFERANLPNTAKFSDRVISLPLHLELRPEDIHTVANIIREGW